MSNTTIDYPAELMPYCHEIENFLNKRLLKIHLDIFFNAFTFLIGIVLLIHQFMRAKIFIHGNLLILFSNIVLLDFLVALCSFIYYARYRILLYFYKHPCELLSPTCWMAPVFSGPIFLSGIAFPHFHFFIMIERWRATLKWTISFAYFGFCTITAFADSDIFGHPLGVMILTTKYNSQVTLFLRFYNLPVIILTAIGDYFITRFNSRKKELLNQWEKTFSNSFGNYSLGQKFQIKENLLAMRLILPLDISYVFIYAVYMVWNIIIRMNQKSLSTEDFIANILDATTFLNIYVAATIAVYIQFIRYIQKNRKISPQKTLPKLNDEMHFHFKQLEKQWA